MSYSHFSVFVWKDTVVTDKLYDSPRYLTIALITESKVLITYNVKNAF